MLRGITYVMSLTSEGGREVGGGGGWEGSRVWIWRGMLMCG